MKLSSRVLFRENIRDLTGRDLDPDKSILVFDQRLRASPLVGRFPRRYGVRAGESLKEIESLPRHLKKIVALSAGLARDELTLVVLGGGSVGDFGGFVASILKRGVRLVQVPSTWLAAVDSAHGGKTALNVGLAKNQVGTFHAAEKVILVREILRGQGPERAADAAGEVLKMILLDPSRELGAAAARKFLKGGEIWPLLPKLIRGKMKVVQSDPFETRGRRYILNFGHTLGHVAERELGLAHGRAVLFGMRFALHWSGDAAEVLRTADWGLPDAEYRRHLARLLARPARVRQLLAQDKKAARAGRVKFVFLKRIGQPTVRPVTLDQILNEMRRQLG